jgi:hypothetical protein
MLSSSRPKVLYLFARPRSVRTAAARRWACSTSSSFVRVIEDVCRNTFTPVERISFAFSMAAVSSPASFWRIDHAVAFAEQLYFSSAR